MTFDVYRAIQEHAPDNSSVAAGNLHEELWKDLLRRADPRFHGVRVTRGDGGLDGVQFLDAATGDARIFQAKFFKDLKVEPKATKVGKKVAAGIVAVARKAPGKKPASNANSKTAATGHRAEVIDSFVRAHSHAFSCSSWVLLFPCVLSHGDLNWLMGGMKTEATAEAKTRPGLPADIDTRIAACAIEFLDADTLNDWLVQYLDVAAKHLPLSTLALSKALEDERATRDRDREELVKDLRVLRDDAVRARDAETRRAKAALSILNQGWGNLTGMLQAALANQALVGKTFEEIGTQVEDHASNRAVHAYACEGLVPGASLVVAEIVYQARLLRQIDLLTSLGLAAAGSQAGTATRIVTEIKKLQGELGRVSALIEQ